MEKSEEKMIAKISQLKKYLPEKSREQLEEILKYGEKIKAEGEGLKQKFWIKGIREEFVMMCRYLGKYRGELEKQYKYLDKMGVLERKRFIKEYLYNHMLYNCIDRVEKVLKPIGYSYDDWEKGFVRISEGINLYFDAFDLGDERIEMVINKLKLKPGIDLQLSSNKIGNKGVKAISCMELKDGVVLGLNGNEIGDEGAEIISHIKLKEGVSITLVNNEIGDEGAIAIAKNMELKKGVNLDLHYNNIGLKGVEAIAKYMNLKEGVTLNLRFNELGDEGMVAIAENMKLEKWVTLKLGGNGIQAEGLKALAQMEMKEGVNLDLENNCFGDEGAEALSHIKLMEGMTLALDGNDIGDEGAKAIMKNMELKEGVTLYLKGDNKISKEMKGELESWMQSYIKRGITCEVRV